MYPAYVAMDGPAMSYEYVLMDEENQKLIYVYLRGQEKSWIEFDKKFLPAYYDIGASAERDLSIYYTKS